MATAKFDLRGLFLTVDTKRQRLGLSWAALAREVSVATSTIRRYENADDAEADGVLALIHWLDVAPEDYIDDDSVAGKRLGDPTDGYVRVDMELVSKANGDSRGARGRTRTSIQNLVGAAQRSGQSVSSLTRLSEV